MTKRYKPSKGALISKYNTSDYTGPKLKPKSYPSPHKDVPVLKDKPEVRPRRSKKGPIRYGKSRTITYAEQQRVKELAAVEKKQKLGDKKISRIRRAFARVPLAAFRLGGGGGGGAGRK